MKQKIILLLTVSVFTMMAYSLFAQVKNSSKAAVEFGGRYCDAYELPMVVNKGSLVRIGCDTAIVINSHRHKLYELSRMAVLQMNLDLYRQLPEASTDWKQESELAYNSLLFKYRELDSLCNSKLTESENRLSVTRNDLAATRTGLQSALDELGQAKAIIKEEHRKKGRNKFFFGLGCLGMGIICGMMIGG